MSELSRIEINNFDYNFKDIPSRDKAYAYGPYESVQTAHTALLSKGLNTVGMTIGIVSPNNMVVEYWYQGGTAQVNLVLKQSEIEQVKSINNIPLSGAGNIEVVQADFEDLANDKGTLKLADKAYAPNDFSGMGRVYLRKNMINASLHFAEIISDLPSTETDVLFGSYDEIVYETTNNRFLAVKHTSEGKKYYPNYQFTDSEVYSEPDDKHIYVCDANAKLYTYENGALEETTTLMDKNVLTQDMMNKPNTIYIIQYDYYIVDMVNDSTTNNLTIGGEYYSYKPITIEDNQTYRALNDCVFVDYHHNSLIGSVLVTGENESQDFAIAKKSSAASGVPVSYYRPNGTITIPANCTLQFEGGSIKSCKDINLSNNCHIIGNDTLIGLAGTIKMNTNCVVSGIRFVRNNSMQDDESMMLFDDDYFARTSSEINSKVEKCSFAYLVGDGQNTHGNVVELVSKGGFLHGGYYGVTFRDVTISSYAKNAFYIHSETVDNNDGWITEVYFDKVFVTMAVNGWKINSNSAIDIQKISLVGCGMQSHTWSKHGLDIGKANRINVQATEFWDWRQAKETDEHGVVTEYSPLNVTDETSGVYIDYLSFWDYSTNGVIGKHNNSVHIMNWYSTSGFLSQVLELTTSVPEEPSVKIPRDIKMCEWFGIPDGIYTLPFSTLDYSMLGLNNRGGTLIVNSNYGVKTYIFIAASDSGYEKNKVSFMSLVSDYSDDTSSFSNKATTLWVNPYVRMYENAAGAAYPSGAKVGDVFVNSLYAIPAIYTNDWELLYTRAAQLIGPISARPSLENYTKDKGKYYFDTNIEKLIIWNGTKWVDSYGFTAWYKSGGTSYRPVGKHEENGDIVGQLEQSDVMYLYYDTTINEHIYAKTIDNTTGKVTWVNSKGVDVEGVNVPLRGATSVRETLSSSLSSVNEGLDFYDETLHKWICWNGSEWNV